MLRTDYNESLAATIELSLASPTFRELDPEARDLLGVVAFFPQGINEHNIDWLFPTVSDRANIFDKFCNLSLTHRSNGFITMLAPLRDYLGPKDPISSPLLLTTKECYFRRLSVKPNPNRPGFGETRWIISEDVNIEHLLDVFTTVDTNSDDVWGLCGRFVMHLQFHKPRLVVLGPKIEGLADDHPLKPWCLVRLSHLIYLVGNNEESKRLRVCALKLWRERGDDLRVARTLRHLSNTNRMLGLFEEGVEQAKEALEAFEQHSDAPRRGKTLLPRLVVARWRAVRRRRGSRIPSDRSPLGHRQPVSGLQLPPRPWRHISVQGRDREGRRPPGDGPRDRVIVQLARSPVLDTLLPGMAVLRPRQVR